MVDLELFIEQPSADESLFAHCDADRRQADQATRRHTTGGLKIPHQFNRFGDVFYALGLRTTAKTPGRTLT